MRSGLSRHVISVPFLGLEKQGSAKSACSCFVLQVIRLASNDAHRCRGAQFKTRESMAPCTRNSVQLNWLSTLVQAVAHSHEEAWKTNVIVPGISSVFCHL